MRASDAKRGEECGPWYLILAFGAPVASEWLLRTLPRPEGEPAVPRSLHGTQQHCVEQTPGLAFSKIPLGAGGRTRAMLALSLSPRFAKSYPFNNGFDSVGEERISSADHNIDCVALSPLHGLNRPPKRL